MKNGKDPSPPDWMKSFGSIGNPKLSNRDAACKVLPDLDYVAQLVAISHALRRHHEADEELQREIADIEEEAQRTSGLRNMVAVSERTDRLYTSVYQDAAHSMAAVGMLAPMIESMFYQAFQGIRQVFHSETKPPTNHARWQQPAEDQWDCHFVWSKGRRSENLVEGIMQLADAVGLKPHLPGDLQLTLQALFEYRNKMFHCGFEWSLHERHKFAKRIADAKWPADWFATATSGGEPWVFYMTDAFVQRVIEMLDQVICGIGTYCKAMSGPSNSTGEAEG